MVQAAFAPREFVHYLSKIGLPTLGGPVPLTSYLCQIEGFGGNDNAASLLGQLRYMKIEGMRLGAMTRHFDLMVKGQGYPGDFSLTWNFMCRNLDDVRKLKIQIDHLEKTDKKDDKGKLIYNHVKDRVLALSDVFRPGRPFPDGMAELMALKCFGWDCIGFVSQYLVAVGHLDEYPSWTPKAFLGEGKRFKPIKDLTELAPLCVATFGDAHIVIVDTVHSISVESEKPRKVVANVTVCQSYTGGPHVRRHCVLTQLGDEIKDGLRQFTQTGIIDSFGAKVHIGKNADLSAAYIAPGYKPFVPGVDDDQPPAFVPGVR